MSFLNNPDPLDPLVKILVEETKQGRVRWEPADPYGSAYIAKRASGTVAISGGLVGGNYYTLTVRDKTGTVVDETSSMSILSSSLLGSGARLETLWKAVEERVRAGSATVQALVNEFRESHDG